MSRLWPFRSLPNFLLTSVGLFGVGFYGFGVYNEQNFSNPIVSEAVKVLGKNEKVKEMIGYPLSYQSSTKNKFNEKGNQLYFDFKVMGPRGSTEVEVTATKLKAKEVYEYETENEPLKAAQAKYNSLKQELQGLQPKSVKSSSSTWFGKKQNNNIQTESQQYQRKIKEVEDAKKAVQQIQNERKLRKNQYCIPEKEYYTEIVSQTGKNNENILPEEATLYKLQNIACQLPNKSRINVLNSGQAYSAEDYETKLDEKVNFSDFKKPVYGPLHQKLSINVAQLSDEEIQQYSKHKTNFMYQKYNQYRILAFMCFLIGSGALFLYFSKNKTKSMSNSVLYQIVTNKISRHPKIDQFLTTHKLKQLDLDKNVGGGMKNNVFNCQIGVNNVTMGRVEVEGKHNPKQGTYDYSKLTFKYVEDNVHKEIDLLK